MKTDYLYALENILPIKKLRRIIFAITGNCNSKCKTCNIWKETYEDCITLKDIERFAGSNIFKEVRFLSLTGGEPFLRKDIDQIVNTFKKKNPRLHIAILTNALMPELIYEKVKNMPRDVLITMSFNGREETHDKTRGVKGNFKKLLKTIEYLKKLKQNINFIFTVTKENYDQVFWAWNFAKKHNINILFNPEMDYGRLNTDSDRNLTDTQKKKVLDQLKKIYSQRKRPFFDHTYFLFFKKLYKRQDITNKCYAGTNSIYVDFDGSIYPCENLVGRINPLGNIRKKFRIPKDYTSDVTMMRCYEGCFLLCEMVRNLRKHPIKTLMGK